jgi:hypothetical protein
MDGYRVVLASPLCGICQLNGHGNTSGSDCRRKSRLAQAAPGPGFFRPETKPQIGVNLSCQRPYIESHALNEPALMRAFFVWPRLPETWGFDFARWEGLALDELELELPDEARLPDEDHAAVLEGAPAEAESE